MQALHTFDGLKLMFQLNWLLMSVTAQDLEHWCDSIIFCFRNSENEIDKA